MTNFDDKPITRPDEDQFGFNAFAKAISEALLGLRAPDGSVISINGPWGSGKSSIVNLVKHHLNANSQGNDIKVIDFNCWWFRGEEALALEFFRELYSATDISNSEKAKEAVSKLGSRLLSGSSAFVGAAVNLLGAPGAGSVVSAGMDILSGLIKQDRTVESFYKDLSDELRKSSNRFLIVVDDIDRLAPDEVLLTLRLIKSVGRLPNVMYLLAYDRNIAERIISERYPSEGPQYLEKIVQAGFDIPSPSRSSLINSFIRCLNELWEGLESPDVRHFWNLFHDVVSPEISSPRDLLRLINALRVSWPAVEGELDPVDFLCLETLRVQRPTVYTAIRANKERLTDGGLKHSYQNRNDVAEFYEQILLDDVEGEEKDKLKIGLRRLFPALDNIWDNLSYSGASYQRWERQRRVCSKKHFDTYFRFSLAEGTVSMKEVRALIDKCDDTAFVEGELRQAKELSNDRGGTRAATLLDELNVHADRIPLAKAEKFLSAVFAVHDELHTEADREHGFAISSNNLRTHWLMRSVVRDRTTLEERSAIIKSAAAKASVGWLVDLAGSAYRDYHPREGKSPEPESECITTENDANELRKMALIKIEQSASDGTLLNYESLVVVLYALQELAGESGHESARKWCLEQLANDNAVEKFAHAFISTSWTQGIGGFGGLGDTVAVRKDQVSETSLTNFFDVSTFRKRVEQVCENSSHEGSRHAALKHFLDAWDRKEDDD